MITSWKNKAFSLDLADLWTIHDPISLPSDFGALFNRGWTSFLQKCESKKIGFFDWPQNVQSTLQETQALADDFRSKYEGAICMGIGGSFLGPAALQDIFNFSPASTDLSVHWISNVDSASIEKATRFVDSRKCMAVIISKSGGTTETLAAWFHFSHRFGADATVVITDPKQGELRRLSRELGWKSLEVQPNIGGRFSVLTPVGLFPLALQGVQIGELISGAAWMREELLKTSPENNPSLWLAYSKFLWTQKGCPIQYLMPYDSRLSLLAQWYVQLWAESLGKKQIGTHVSVGPNPVAALGTSDQHSLLQLFKEGPRQRVIGFLTCEDKKSPKVGAPIFPSPDYEYLTQRTFAELNQSASESTQESLRRAQVPTYRFHLSELSPFCLGAFIFFQEVACALAGEFFGVDAFNQPGVEETKIIWKDKLTQNKPVL